MLHLKILEKFMDRTGAWRTGKNPGQVCPAKKLKKILVFRPEKSGANSAGAGNFFRLHGIFR
jgi:hypothetical protein